MYLKRLELHGFKSFAPRTVLEFSPGITAIVGPNGAGKSNVADAIRWVLGEQSMRTLRGRKSDDVIFAGASSKAAAQMAEVGLVLDNSAAWLPSDFSEVTVARRSFRNGDSEYLMNGQRVRLKDVLLLLAQARIGHDSYTVIGQGLVDQALSQRAEERRGLFEDAAGIRQFQAQRTDAEQKLTLTQSNLARLNDIIGEIEPRLGPLAEQARRARDFSSAREELMRLLRIWYRRQWRDTIAARARTESAEAEFAARLQKVRDALAVEDALITDLTQQRETLAAELADLRRTRGEAAGRAQTLERELAVARERLSSLDRQEVELTQEQEQQGDAVAVAQAHVGAIEAQAARAEQEQQQAEAALKQIEQALHTARQEQEREEARLRAAQRDVIQVQARLGAAQTELGRLQKQLGDRNRVLAARRDAAAQAQRKLDAAKEQADKRREAFEKARAGVEALVARREDLSRELADGQAAADRLRGEAADTLRERRALADRLALLEEWRRSLEGFGDGVKALLHAKDAETPAMLGVVAQLIGVPQGYEDAIEAALGPLLHAVVVASPADARAAADWLRERGAGRAVFAWPRKGTALAASDSLPKSDGQDLLGLARERVSASAEVAQVVARLLGDTYIVRERAVADRLWKGKSLPAPVVTLDGDQLHPDGWLRGGGTATKGDGRAGGASVLARERELRQLPAELDRLDAAAAELQARHDAARTAQEQRRTQIEALRKQLQRDEAAAQELARAVTNLQREQERAEADLRVGQGMVEQLAAEVRGLDQEVEATAVRVAEQEQAHREAAERVDDVQAEVDELLASTRGQQEELARARTAAALQQQEVKVLAQRAEQVRVQAREQETQMARRGERLKSLRMQRASVIETAEAQEQELATLRERLRELTEAMRERETRAVDAERQMHELERGQSQERAELARLEVQQQRAATESQRGREALDALAQQIREELATEDDDADPLDEIIGGADSAGAERSDGPDAAAEPTAEETAKTRRQIDALRNRLRHLGGYDPEAPQAYEELKTRYDFLTGQVRDMQQASTNLRSVIAELDATMRRQFEETFHAVNERFQRHFTTLFSGGAARLELTVPRRSRSEDDDDEDDAPNGTPAKQPMAGVEVYVQIPGKKVQDLSLLSGGERAMVSVALLFALLETNPPPFCLLDEVDAALDEANVVRFCEILRVLGERTQFIVITHNRVTMTHADVFYGVSMPGEGISRVLSMELAEAAATAR
ncbi:MAG TPA: chromosome segregation protein SMC [Ktedonobacterales bacterium]|nr:chromosome segregation protein SMC [Ktedonobacterales bacterium]